MVAQYSEKKQKQNFKVEFSLSLWDHEDHDFVADAIFPCRMIVLTFIYLWLICDFRVNDCD